MKRFDFEIELLSGLFLVIGISLCMAGRAVAEVKAATGADRQPAVAGRFYPAEKAEVRAY